MHNPNLNKLNPAKFTEIIKNREAAIAGASTDAPIYENNANRLAQQLHPHKQYLSVCEITELEGAKTFKLQPDPKSNTQHCAYFSAGQYLTVYVEIDGKIFSRPYSIVSSPRESLQGYYLITVKRVFGGIVSNHILDNWEIGTSVTVSDPIGNFTYEPLRDSSHIVGIAGGSGVTPFISLAKSISEGDEDCSLTLIYGNRTKKDIYFKRELDTLASQNEKIKVIYVLSDEQADGYESGNITAKLINKYAPKDTYSIFICGPDRMTDFVNKQIKKLNIERKFVRNEVHGEIINPIIFSDYTGCDYDTVNITVTVQDKKITVSGKSNQSILRILEENGVAPPSHCRSGECGFCRSRLISGRIYTSDNIDKRRQADDKHGYIHPCCSYPLSDLEIEISKN